MALTLVRLRAMCGIGGIYLRNGSNFNPNKLKKLFTKLEDRGQHASGIAYLWKDADKPIVKKDSVKASVLTKKMSQNMGTMIQYALLHTRYATQGNTENNHNNHPVIRDSIIMTHNGVISNDTQMFDYMERDPLYEVDTEALVAGVAFNGISWTAQVADGSMSVAWVDTDEVNTVNLFTNGRNPLVIAKLQCGSIVWASGYHHLEHYKPIRYFHATPGVMYSLSSKGITTTRIEGSWPKYPNVLRQYYRGKVY